MGSLVLSVTASEHAIETNSTREAARRGLKLCHDLWEHCVGLRTMMAIRAGRGHGFAPRIRPRSEGRYFRVRPALVW